MIIKSAGLLLQAVVVSVSGWLSTAFSSAAQSRVTLSLKRAIPMVCDDWPASWRDRAGRTCADYEGGQLCTPSGNYGQGWRKEWGAFRTYGNEGQTALGACCACGGGWHSNPQTCSYLQCPDGFRVKEDAWKIYCKDIQCTVEVDIWTCCQAHPDVKDAVEQVKNLTAEQIAKVRDEVRTAGEKEVERLRDLTAEEAVHLGKAFVNESTVLQEQALKAAQEKFAKSTQHSDTLGNTSEYQMTMSGYLAARDAPEGFVHPRQLQAKLSKAMEELSTAQEEWQRTNQVSRGVVSTGQREWAAYYADLNATWPVIVHGINRVNHALGESTAPRQAVRWTEQAVRVAADSAEILQGEMQGLDTEVKQAEARAAAALKATQGNREIITTLQAMVDKLRFSR